MLMASSAGSSCIQKGQLSPGFVKYHSNCFFEQNDGAAVATEPFAFVNISGNGRIQQKFGAQFRAGQLSQAILGSTCNLQMDEGTVVQFQNGNGRAYLVCNATWNMLKQSTFLIAPQGSLLLNNTGNLTMDELARIKIDRNAALLVDHSGTLALLPQTFLHLGPSSRLEVLGAHSRMEVEASNTGEISSLSLGPSSVFISNGTTNFGKGQVTQASLGSNGLLEVSANAIFDIRAAQLDIGESSTWILKPYGTLTISSGSRLQSEVQSNLTIGEHGSILASGEGSLYLGGLSSTVINGDISPLQGILHVGQAAQFEMEPSSALNVKDKAAGFVLGDRSRTVIGKGTTVSFGQGAKVTLTNQGTLIIGNNLICNIQDSFHIARRNPMIIRGSVFKSWITCFNS